MGCVLAKNGLPEKVTEWLNAESEWAGWTNCDVIVDAAETINKHSPNVLKHSTGGNTLIQHAGTGSTPVYPFSYMHAAAGGAGALSATGWDESIEHVHALAGSFASNVELDETDLGSVVNFAKAVPTTSAKIQQQVADLESTSRALDGNRQVTLDELRAAGSADPGTARLLVMNSLEHVYKDLKPLVKAAKDLKKKQLEYQELFAAEAAANKERLDELKAKAAACNDVATAVAANPDFADLTAVDPNAEPAARDAQVEYLKNKKLCADGLTPEETAELKGLITQVQASLGAGEMGNVGMAIATAQEPTKRTFKEQCLLLSNIVHFTEYREEELYKKVGKRKPYKEYTGTSGSINANASLLVDRQPWGFMNQLVQDPSFATFFDIPPHFLSQLQPMIRLYKISSAAGNTEREVEVTFDGAYNQAFDGILRGSDKRGFGVGIQNFTFSYEGSDPFSVKKSIKARLSIFASSFDDLLKPRGEYRYADLALKTGTKFSTYGSSEVEFNNLAKLNFRLKAVVGWAIPGRLKGATDAETENLIKSIHNSFVTLNLTPTIHEFDIKDDGRVVFNIDYLAYVDEFFDEASFNIFSNKHIQKRIFSRRMATQAMAENCSNKSEEFLKETQEALAEQVDDDKRTQLASIMKQLLNSKKVYFKSIPFESLKEFNSKGPYWKFDLFTEDTSDIKETDESTAEATKVEGETAEMTAPKDDKDKKAPDLSSTEMTDINRKEFIAFFYLSDLVDIILHNIDQTLEALGASDAYRKGKKDSYKSLGLSKRAWDDAVSMEMHRTARVYNNFKKFRLILGPMELIDVKTREYKTVNIGDLPISTAYFMDWLTDKTLKRDNVIYSLPIFLKDLVNNLIREFLNEDKCFDLNIKQRVRMFQSSVTSYNKGGEDRITDLIERQGSKAAAPYNASGKLNLRRIRNTQPVLHVMGERDSPVNSRGAEDTYNYAVFYAGRTQPQEKMTGDAASDAAAGVFHYVLGKDTGIVKNIQLSKTDSPGLKEVRFEQEGYDGLMQLREVYDASITCYGAPNVVPGTYIYIDPRGFAPNAYKLDLDRGWSEEYNEASTRDKFSSRASLTRLGIGGYYMVTRAENTYGGGQCETKISAKWVAELGSGNGKKDVAGRQKTRKCKS